MFNQQPRKITTETQTDFNEAPANTVLPPQRQQARQKQTILIGDSLIRYISPKSANATVLSIPGAKINDISSHLSTANQDSVYNEMILQVRTNDLSNMSTTEAIISDYSNLLTLAKPLCNDRVTVVSIPPRTDTQDVQGKIDEVNHDLALLCQREGVTFIDNDCTFKFRNNSVDRSLLYRDGIHLSVKGIRKMLENAQLGQMFIPGKSFNQRNEYSRMTNVSNRPRPPRPTQVISNP
ncbi:uncharacterized protein [Ptychodera flava]|uniref:uncharacterized protein n=1 Tax=Ptychodera flava TaxID=63121 RepID=UPI00396A2CA3